MWALVLPVMQALAWPKFLLPVPDIYFADYVSRVVVIGAFLALGVWRLAGPSRSLPWWQVAALAGVLVLALPALDMARFMVPWPWFLDYGVGYPPLESPPLVLFDLTIGLALVAVAEEVAFRKVFWAVWAQREWPLPTLASSLAFGLLHAPQGVAAVVSAAVAGVLLMAAYRASGTLWLPIGLHYWTNLLAFGGLHGTP